MKRSQNLLKYPLHVLRGKFIQPLFWGMVFLGPILDVFRVDAIAQRMIFLRQAYPFEFQYMMWVPIVFYGLVLVIAFVSFVWGRLFCGWTCPHNTMTEWTRPIRAMVRREPKPPWMKRLIRKAPALDELMIPVGMLVSIPLTISLSVLLSFYIVPPAWVMAQYAAGQPHIALVFGHALFTLIGLFLLFAGHDFCRTCCPYGLAQSISAYHEGSRWKPMEIGFTQSSTEVCKSCTVCQQVCPVDIDPRTPVNLKVGQFDGCFNCGECIDACRYIHDFKKQPGFLRFEAPGFRRKAQETASLAGASAGD